MTTTRCPDLGCLPLEDVLRPLTDPEDLAALMAAPQLLFRLARGAPEGEAALLGLRDVTRARLAAAFELARRRTDQSSEQPDRIRSAEDAVRICGERLKDEPTEIFQALLLDARHGVLASPRISVGSLSASLVHPREFFRPAVLARAAAAIALHNHPSGDPTPSAEDDHVTERLARAGEILGIPLLDHLVVAETGWFSYREQRPRPLRARSEAES